MVLAAGVTNFCSVIEKCWIYDEGRFGIWHVVMVRLLNNLKKKTNYVHLKILY